MGLMAPTSGSESTTSVSSPSCSRDTTSSSPFGSDSTEMPPRMMMPISSERSTTPDVKFSLLLNPPLLGESNSKREASRRAPNKHGARTSHHHSKSMSMIHLRH